MFEALRKNIQTVQENISAGLQKLSSSDKTPTTPTEPEIKFTATNDLLELYQTQWATMHHMAEENSKAADIIDKKITKIVEEYESQHGQLAEIHSLLAHLPNIMSQLHSSLATIGKIKHLFEEVESELLDLENLEEELELQEKILDLKVNVALKREKNSHHLTQYKNELHTSHLNKVAAFEKGKEQSRKKKEEELISQFQHDMKLYQEGKLVKKSERSPEHESKLEDIVLEQDNQVLDSFLSEVS